MSMIPPISSVVGCSERYGTNRFLMQQQHNHHHHHQQLQQQQQQQQHPVPSSSPGCNIGGYYGSNQPRQCQQQQQQQQQHISLSRPQHPNNYMIGCFTQNPNGWAGVPLISTAARRPRKMHGYNNNNNSNNNSSNNNSTNIKQRLLISSSTEYDENAMSRLAIHAHGAPLILAGRYRNRVQKYSNVNNNNNNINNKQGNSGVGCSSNNQIKNKIDISDINSDKGIVPNGVGKNATDSGSVASDESLSNGTTNTEACLPRIIKPRKRRKKDRKPQNGVCLPDNNNVALTSNNNNHHQQQNQQDTSCLVNPYRIVEQNLTNNMCPPYIETNNNILLSLDDYNNKSHLLQNNDENFGRIQPLQDISSASLAASNCYCRLCDPSCRIWAFPLRRSCSDNSAEIEIQKNNHKDVGVIGSNRSWSSRNEWRSSLQIDNNITSCSSSSNQDNFPSRNGSFSDSGDSGCDILSGINFAEDLFNNNNNNNNKNYNIISNNDIILPIPIGQEKDINNKKLLNNFPTAESLLTESINEISKK